MKNEERKQKRGKLVGIVWMDRIVRMHGGHGQGYYRIDRIARMDMFTGIDRVAGIDKIAVMFTRTRLMGRTGLLGWTGLIGKP